MRQGDVRKDVWRGMSRASSLTGRLSSIPTGLYETQQARGNFRRNFPTLSPCYYSLTHQFQKKFYISITISTFCSQLSLFWPTVLASVPPIYRLFSSLPTSGSLERYALIFLPLCSNSLSHLDVHEPSLSSIGTLVLPFTHNILTRFTSQFNPHYSSITILQSWLPTSTHQLFL